MVAPPFELGDVKAMLALALPAVAAPTVGAPGTITEAEGVDEPPHADKANAILTLHRPMKGNFEICVNMIRLPGCAEHPAQ